MSAVDWRADTFHVVEADVVLVVERFFCVEGDAFYWRAFANAPGCAQLAGSTYEIDAAKPLEEAKANALAWLTQHRAEAALMAEIEANKHKRFPGDGHDVHFDNLGSDGEPR